MRISLSADQARRLRLRAQRLSPRLENPPEGPAQVARETCGLQAQESPAATLAVRARASGLSAAAVERARLEERSIVRTWAMRGTLHLLATEDLAWLLPLVGPAAIAASRSRYLQLGLDEEASARSLRAVRQALAEQGPLTRSELASQLQARGIRAEGQVLPHLLRRAALEGLICQGPNRNGQPAYALLQDWARLDPAPSPEAAQGELARRYLAAYGPAAPEDLAYWSGLPLRAARRAWEQISARLIEVELTGRPAWMLAESREAIEQAPASHPSVRLLPRFDIYLLGYASRALALDPRHARLIHPGGGLLRAALLVDGRVVGRWNGTRRGRRYELQIEPFAPLPAELSPALEAEAADLGRFLELEVAWQAPGRL